LSAAGSSILEEARRILFTGQQRSFAATDPLELLAAVLHDDVSGLAAGNPSAGGVHEIA
jgi:hypothetical protein